MHRREKSGPEKEFEQLAILNNWPYKFVGNGVFRVGKYNPDFIHDTKRKVIEIYGDFYHRGDDPQKRIDIFKKYGYSCIVIWASELCNTDLIFQKISRFELED